MSNYTRFNRVIVTVLGLTLFGFVIGIALGWVEVHLSQPALITLGSLSLPLVARRFLRLIFILIGAYLARRILTGVLCKALSNYISKAAHSLLDEEAEKKRAETLVSVLSNLGSFAIGAATILILFSEIGINIAPLIAGVGVLGLGVGLACQTLVKDYISGFFILFENQFNVGDLIEIGGKKGTVEELSLRTTVLKDAEGNIHIIPNNKIATVTRFKDGSQE